MGKLTVLCRNWFLIDPSPSFPLIDWSVDGADWNNLMGFLFKGSLVGINQKPKEDISPKKMAHLPDLYFSFRLKICPKLWFIGQRVYGSIMKWVWPKWTYLFLVVDPVSRSPPSQPPSLVRVGKDWRQWGSDSNRAQGTWGALIK